MICINIAVSLQRDFLITLTRE